MTFERVKQQLPGHAPQPIRVSLVTPHEPTRTVLGALIARIHGLELVSTYADADSALLLIPALKAEIILLDAQLQGMFWTECVRRLKDTVPGLRVVVMAEPHDHAAALLSLAADADGCVFKEPGLTDIPQALLEICRDGTPHCPLTLAQMASTLQRIFIQPSIAATNQPGKEVLSLWLAGTRRKDIALKLRVSIDTTKTHLWNIRRKLGAHTREEAAAKLRALRCAWPQ
jgi:DNA-binding NarL/FixJ family response regulator